ncbi:MAG: hypothetical protein A2351_07995 [Omnitrophica bacterium RIFOXYB12_FULL_50_7]|nr:MAG: hypothetical protein A2351_07995 [Omnitrophica bacterium RIFOXYB12_FULL_50_7]
MKKRKFKISPAIIDSASECLNHLSCLSGSGTMCKIKKQADNRVMFVRKHGHQNCPFAIPLGADCICTCPVRVEIYRKYRV